MSEGSPSVRLQGRPHRSMGVMKSGAGGPRRDPERVGDLGGRVPLVVVEHEDRTLFGRQAAKPAFELVPVGDAQDVVRCSRTIDREQSQVGDPPPLAHRLADAFTDDQTMQPDVEPIRITQVPQVAPRDHEGVLERILGSVDVAEDALGDREESIDPDAEQIHICGPVAAAGRLDEVAIHPKIRP